MSEGPHPPVINEFDQELFSSIKDYSPEFYGVLTTIASLHLKKNQDYADKSHRYSNFTYAATMAEPFINPVDKVFATMIGIKMARLAELIDTGKTANNESVKDTFDDLVNYSAIWNSWRRTNGREPREGTRGNQRGVSEGADVKDWVGTERTTRGL